MKPQTQSRHRIKQTFPYAISQSFYKVHTAVEFDHHAIADTFEILSFPQVASIGFSDCSASEALAYQCESVRHVSGERIRHFVKMVRKNGGAAVD